MFQQRLQKNSIHFRQPTTVKLYRRGRLEEEEMSENLKRRSRKLFPQNPETKNTQKIKVRVPNKSVKETTPLESGVQSRESPKVYAETKIKQFAEIRQSNRRDVVKEMSHLSISKRHDNNDSNGFFSIAEPPTDKLKINHTIDYSNKGGPNVQFRSNQNMIPLKKLSLFASDDDDKEVNQTKSVIITHTNSEEDIKVEYINDV